MTISLSIFLYLYLALLAVFCFFAFFSLYHMIRFSFWGFTSFFATFLFIAVVVIVLFISFEHIQQADWQQTFTWQFDVLHLDFGPQGEPGVINSAFQEE
ncbi:hypothetical protein HY933_01070 [Candidatus Falkowbacteria bacterium]|nr:hypothetical protein [Candidatus Falkowbacteria bacterium]